MQVTLKGMPHRKEFSIGVRKDGPGEITILLTGKISLEDLQEFLDDIRSLPQKDEAEKIHADLSAVDYLDSSGGLALLQVKSQAEGRGASFDLVNMNEHARRIMDLIVREAQHPREALAERRSSGLLERIDDDLTRVFSGFFNFITFSGEVFLAAIYSVFHPGSIRWNDFLSNMKKIGLDGLPIIGLISLLLGLIIAFMSSIQLKQFGANLYVASLVAIGMIRELGPVMTAVMVAGRSGSAFAAEIGTMKVNEEVNALVTMGFDPTRFLVIPKVLAAVIVVPILTLYSDLFAICGGLIVGVLGLNLTVTNYLQQTQMSVTAFDIISSAVKTVFFAICIAVVGCQRGLQARGGAQSVGVLTTSAVVSAISLIIVIDSIFAIVLQFVDYGRMRHF